MKKIDTLEPRFKAKIEKLLAILLVMGIKCVVTDGRRTLAEQHAIWKKGRDDKGNVIDPKAVRTKADAGQSPHNFGLAADLCPLDVAGELWWDAPDDVWQVIHNVCEDDRFVNEFNLDLDSAYDWTKFQDHPHIEDPHWREVQAAWREGKVQVA